MYDITISKTAKKKLKSLPSAERTRLVEKITWLGLDPDDIRLDVKPMENEDGYYRLRVGDWRVIFMRDDIIQLIRIERIKPRGDVYK